VGKGRRRGGGRFSRRNALCACALQGLTHAEAFHYTTWADRWPVARWRHASVNPAPSPRACGARPSAKWPSDAKNGLRGQSRYDARGVFLGGARSPRPDCKVLLMPRHFITRAGWPGGRGLMETCLGQAPPFLTGVRSPPLRGGASLGGRPCGGKPGDGAEGGFLGGAHSVRPSA
jgi:hypothetical protein